MHKQIDRLRADILTLFVTRRKIVDAERACGDEDKTSERVTSTLKFKRVSKKSRV